MINSVKKNEPGSDGREWQRGVARPGGHERLFWGGDVRAEHPAWGEGAGWTDMCFIALDFLLGCQEGRGWLSLLLHNLGSIWVCGCLAGGREVDLEGRVVWVGMGSAGARPTQGLRPFGSSFLLEHSSVYSPTEQFLRYSVFWAACFTWGIFKGWGIMVSVRCCTRFLPLSTNW